MMTPTNRSVGAQAGTPAESKSSLEYTYMRLLEQRIAQLEAVIEKGVTNPAEKSDESKTDTIDKKIESEEPLKDKSEEESATAGAEASKSDESKTNGDITKTSEKQSGNSKDEVTKGEEKKAEDSNADDGSRVRSVISKWNEVTNDYETLKAGNVDSKEDKSQTKVTTFRKVMDRDNERKLKHEAIEIKSAELRKLFLECSRHRDPVNFQHDEKLELKSPFLDFAWYHDDFLKACEPRESDSPARAEAREDLKQLLGLVKKSSSMEPYFKTRENIENAGTIKYEHLWSLFPMGERVYAKPLAPTFPDIQMFEVWYCATTPPESHEIPHKPKTTKLYLFGFDCDGVKVDRYYYTMEIKKFEGERSIDMLEIFPTRFYRNSDRQRDDSALQQELLDRGRRFIELAVADTKESQRSYYGTAITQVNAQSAFAGMASGRDDTETAASNSDDEEDNKIGIKSLTPDIRGKIIVDNYSFQRSKRNPVAYMNPPLGRVDGWALLELDCACRACQSSVALQWKVQPTDDLRYQVESFQESEERLRMCPPKVLGYALRQRLWAQFRIKDISNSENSAESGHYFQKELQLDSKYKETLMAFITNHESFRKRRSQPNSRHSIPETFDIVEDKGKGLAILLHGAPGVGKTLTAEAIALATGRPLVVVSVAEVGTDAADAEARLSDIFSDAARWEAILLMDEADVFLEARERTENPNRNALVSVLLRCLEYYEGIIILTTNRIRSFDVAVQSRMHLAIQYDDLSTEQKSAIYRNLIDKIPKSKLDRELKEPKKLERNLEILCRRGKINGRQIRNIVASAMALANHRSDNEEKLKGVLTFDDLEAVHEMTMDFVTTLSEDTWKTRKFNEAGR
ncbi:unnamed protein product [Cercospora beticola]|nr:unnamed protein product [Cercospora beticola]